LCIRHGNLSIFAIPAQPEERSKPWGELTVLAVALLVVLGSMVRPALAADYQELVALAKQGKADIDYAALRIAYADKQVLRWLQY